MTSPGPADKVCPKCKGVFSGDSLYCPDDGTPLNIGTILGDEALTKDPYLGQVIHGDIEIRQLAGVGAMGRVYRAFQRGVDRLVAVKILHRELSTNKEIVGRFHREAHVASRLQHPHVVQVYLTGEMSDKAMYIVMEYLDGLSLQSALSAAGGGLALARALHITLQLCDAVGEAHAQGVVHRDLKPENVMLVRRGLDDDFVKVLDFGIARVNWGDQSMATQQGLIFGTARYISPEGAQGEAVGPESDVYAIATLLYQMLAGETPFDGDQAVGILIRQIGDPPPLLTSHARASNVPRPIADAIMRNLAKPRGQRAPNARTFGRMLLDAIRESGLNVEDLLTRPSLLGPIQYEAPRADAGAAAKPGAREGTAKLVATPIPLPAKTAPLREVPDARHSPVPPGADPRGLTAKWIPDEATAARITPEPPSPYPYNGSPRPYDGYGANSPGALPVGSDRARLEVAPTDPFAPRRSSQLYPTAVGSPGQVPPPYESAYDANAQGGAHAEGRNEFGETMGTARRGRLLTVVIMVVCLCLGMIGMILIARSQGLIGKADPTPTNIPPLVINPPLSTIPSASSSASDLISLPPLAGSATGPVTSPADAPKIKLTVEVTPPKPTVGQTIELLGKVSASRPAKRIDSGIFVIQSGSSPAVTINATQDTAGFHGTYTIPSLGPTVINFSVRFDNFRAKTVQTITIGGGTEGPPVAPTASVKWI